MERISSAEFQELLQAADPVSISIYLPTEEVGLAPSQRRAELQNFETEVTKELDTAEVPDALRRKISEKFAEIRENPALWEVNQKGLALFLSPNFSKVLRLPSPVRRLISVSHRFHLKPLIHLFSQPCEFYVLFLAKKEVSLFYGDCYEFKKATAPDLPQSVEEVTGVEVNERDLQFHTSPSGGAGGRPAVFHGSSSWKDDKNKYLEKFLQQVDKAVSKYLQNHKQPLLLSGAERLVTLYREVNSYPQLLKELWLKRNDDAKALSELYGQALDVMAPYFVEQEKKDVEAVLAKGNIDRFSVELDEILRQARMGRVDTLLVAEGIREWGTFNPDTLAVTYSSQPTAGTHDLLDTACVETVVNGGKAYVLPLEQIPEQKHAAAIFRY